jgi:hypothetical protein
MSAKEKGSIETLSINAIRRGCLRFTVGGKTTYSTCKGTRMEFTPSQRHRDDFSAQTLNVGTAAGVNIKLAL